MSDEDKKQPTTTSSDSGARRDAIKRTIAVGGMTFALSQWSKPIVDTVVLPAHAQASVVLIAQIVVP